MRSLNCGFAGPAALVSFIIFYVAPLFGEMRHSTALLDPHHHILAIVSMVGAGTADDPMRPMFTSASGTKAALLLGTSSAAITAPRTGIIGYHAQSVDDGKLAIVELIAPSMANFTPILNTVDSRVQVL